MLNIKVSPDFFSTILAAALLGPVLLSICINVFFDPFQLFFRDAVEPVSFLGDQGRDRYQPPGIVHNYDPGGIIIGNSRAANFYPTEIEELFGWRNVYSLTLDGGSLFEQATVAKFAIRSTNVENILWQWAPESFDLAANTTHRKLPFPRYLYNDSRIDDVILYITAPANIEKYNDMKARKRMLLAREVQYTGKSVDAKDRATEWGTIYQRRFNRPIKILESFYGKDHTSWPPNATLSRPTSAFEFSDVPESVDSKKLDHFVDNLNKNVLPIIENNPKVEFTLIVHPPFPLLYWQTMRNESLKRYQHYLYTTHAIVTKLSQHANVRMFAFGNLSSNADLRLYKDKHHFHSILNSFMLSQISRDRGRVTGVNITTYLADFDRVVREYQAQPLHWLTYAQKADTREGLNFTQAQNLLESYLQESVSE